MMLNWHSNVPTNCAFQEAKFVMVLQIVLMHLMNHQKVCADVKVIIFNVQLQLVTHGNVFQSHLLAMVIMIVQMVLMRRNVQFVRRTLEIKIQSIVQKNKCAFHQVNDVMVNQTVKTFLMNSSVVVQSAKVTVIRPTVVTQITVVSKWNMSVTLIYYSTVFQVQTKITYFAALFHHHLIGRDFTPFCNKHTL